jgi:hypothetical protein
LLPPFPGFAWRTARDFSPHARRYQCPPRLDNSL